MDILAAIKTLRSVRQYRDEPIPQAVIERIVEAGRWAGSAKNTQPWQFVIVRRRELLAQLATCGAYASHLREAACAIVVVTPTASHAAFDAGRAIQNMLLAAWADGVGSCVVTLSQQEAARRILAIPADQTVQQAVALGYPQPGVPPMVEGRPLRDVLASLGRRPIGELVSYETWGQRKPDPQAGS
jgi:nitroreductase